MAIARLGMPHAYLAVPQLANKQHLAQTLVWRSTLSTTMPPSCDEHTANDFLLHMHLTKWLWSPKVGDKVAEINQDMPGQCT